MPRNRQVTLFGESLASAVQTMLPKLAVPDQERLQQLLNLSTAERMSLAECLARLFPDHDQAAALKVMTNFRKRFNDLATELKNAVRFVVDSRKRDTPEHRQCWFMGPDPMAARAIQFADQLTADLEGKPEVLSKGIATSSQALASGKRVVRFFVSYAHDDDIGRAPLAESLLKELRKQFNASKRYEIDMWVDKRILLEQRWHNRIQQAITECDFGLFLVSPAFLGSEYIKENEIPHFVKDDATAKPVIPVGLVPIDFRKHDLKGLEQRQFFVGTKPPQVQFFDQMPTGAKKREFVHALYLRIEERLDEHFNPGDRSPVGPDSKLPPAASPQNGCDPRRAHDFLRQRGEELEETDNFQEPKGHAFQLGDLEALKRSRFDVSQARDALPEIECWACDPDGSPFFALLGEYGIGKTTTLKQLTRLLIKKKKSDPGVPLPIYIDLREYVQQDPADKVFVPTIEQLLQAVIERSWKLSDRSVTPQDILHLVRTEGAVIFFDGLDEKIVHMNAERARAFIRTLWSTLPDATRPAEKGVRRGKMLISCRSHYFRDIGSQNSMLVGEQREGISKTEFPTFCLLPFTEDQIRSYLQSFYRHDDPDPSHGIERADEAFELIHKIHNLRDLAERPYLLTQIIQHLDELEQISQRGESVNAARLYELFISSWLNRDDGKHQIEPLHKRLLMEALARDLWISGERQWNADQLEQWMDQFLLEHPAISESYRNKDRAVLKEDLRTATFVLRPDTEEKQFRFAHTSLQEFFLASSLSRALLENRPEAWNIPMPSLETLDFLGQLLVLDPRPRALQTLAAVLAAGGDGARMAFRYWLRARELGYPEPSPKHVKLAGADLDEWRISGGPNTPLNLRGADLSGARVNRCRMENVQLAGANLSRTQWRQALLQNVWAMDTDLRGSDLRGLRWRGGSLAGANLQNETDAPTQLDGVQWLGLDLTAASLPAGWQDHASGMNCRGAESRENKPLAQVRLQIDCGHSNGVSSCAWSPDGSRLASASYDHTVKVWDARSGECLVTATGHSNGVISCAWSPDGSRLASASYDQTVKVWDARSGECLVTATGHSNRVTSCAWSPDGSRLASASYDNTVKVWDACSGECLVTATGHSNRVYSCAWSPDGSRLASASYDNTVKVWDACSGECLVTATGHSKGVNSCAWGPDGSRLATASSDNTVKVWDARSGECLVTATGHSDVVTSCAWSPDGSRLASSSYDRTVKVWDVRSGECLVTATGHSNVVYSCAWSPDCSRLASSSYDQTVKVWDARSGECLVTATGHSNVVNSCAWSPDGSRLASSSYDKTVKVWDARSGECLMTATGHSDVVSSCAWSPDGSRLASSSYDQAVKVWDARSGECLVTAIGQSNWVNSCAWSPDGSRLASASYDKTVKVWDARSGECLLTATGHSNVVNSCAWSPDGSRLASSSYDKTVKVWDARSGECLLTATGHSDVVNSCAWSPDGSRLASASYDNTVKVWDACSGECLLTATGHSNGVVSCAWSPDGSRLASASSDQTVKVWDACSGECLVTATGHSKGVNSCAWGPDGSRLATASSDNTVKVWDARTGECLQTIQQLPECQFVSVDARDAIMSVSPEAWRFIGWRWTDPKTGCQRLLPAESSPLWPRG